MFLYKEVVNNANSIINTQVKKIADKDEIPVEINDKWFNSSDGTYNTGYAPNAINPELFYDEGRKLWMSYGFWVGGIYMLEIDQATCKPIYPGTSGETDSEINVNYNTVDGTSIINSGSKGVNSSVSAI